MTDIYDIKLLLLWRPINVIYSLIILFILIIAYYFLFIKKNNEVVEEKKLIKRPKIKNIDYTRLVQDIKQNLETYNTEKFYHQIDKILRLYLEKQDSKNLETLTLKEIENLELDNIFKNLLKSIYFKEYSNNMDDNIQTRKEILHKLENLILNK